TVDHRVLPPFPTRRSSDLAAWPEREDLARDLLLCEQEGDRITHDIIHRLNGGGNGGRRPFAPDDGHVLATALDDVVDFAEQTARSEEHTSELQSPDHLVCR